MPSLRSAVATLVVALGLSVGLAAPAVADSGPSTTLTTLASPSAIELPNSGPAPEHSGDRGGWAQLTLFGLMTAGMLAIFVRVAYATRQHTKSKARPSEPPRVRTSATPRSG